MLAHQREMPLLQLGNEKVWISLTPPNILEKYIEMLTKDIKMHLKPQHSLDQVELYFYVPVILISCLKLYRKLAETFLSFVEVFIII